MSGWASSSRSANSNADRFIAAGLAPAANHAAFVPPSASVLPRDPSSPEGVTTRNPAPLTTRGIAAPSAGEQRAVRGTAAFRDFGGWTCSSRDPRFLLAAGRLSAAKGYFPFRRG